MKIMGKRTGIILIILMLIFSCTACGSQNPAQAPSASALGGVSEDTLEEVSDGGRPTESLHSGGENPDGEVGSGKVLIAYFSRVGNTEFPEDVDAVSSASLNLKNGELEGNTEMIARMIQQETQGDLFRIETEKTYPADYDELVDYGRNEPEEDARPALSSHIDGMEGYDVVFLGYPNWWFDMPMAVYSFLEEYDFSGKTVIPFCTHGGSRFSDTISTLEDFLPETEILDGFEVYGEDAGEAQEEVLAWLEGLNRTVPILPQN